MTTPTVVVQDIRMPLESMVRFMVKWAVASIPAALIVSGIFLFAASLASLLSRALGG